MVDIAGLTDQVTVAIGAFADQYQLLKGKTVDVSDSLVPYQELSVYVLCVLRAYRLTDRDLSHL